MRPRLVHAAIRVSIISVVWALVVGVPATISGATAGSLALIGLGLNSIVDGSVSAVLVWRFLVERRDPELSERVERAAHRLVAVTLLVVAAYIAVAAIRSLVIGTEPDDNDIGIYLAVAAAAVLPVLAVLKLRLAAQLHSSALRADGVLSAAGAVLALVVLLGLVLNSVFGWWWSDSAAAVFIAAALGTEGWRSLPTPSASVAADPE